MGALGSILGEAGIPEEREPSPEDYLPQVEHNLIEPPPVLATPQTQNEAQDNNLQATPPQLQAVHKNLTRFISQLKTGLDLDSGLTTALPLRLRSQNNSSPESTNPLQTSMESDKMVDITDLTGESDDDEVIYTPLTRVKKTVPATNSLGPIGGGVRLYDPATFTSKRASLPGGGVLLHGYIADSDSDMMDEEMPMTTDNHKQAVHGCSVCSSLAFCATLHATDVWDNENVDLKYHAKREIRQYQGKGIDNWSLFEKKLNAAATQVTYDNPLHEGPFCCSDLRLDLRSSNPSLPDDKKALIFEFIKAAHNPALVIYTLPCEDHDWSDARLRSCSRLFKVNVIKAFEDVSTWIYAPTLAEDQNRSTINYFCIHHFKEPIRFAIPRPFEYCVYRCKKHKMEFKVGVQHKRAAADGHWETFDERKIDIAMKLPMGAAGLANWFMLPV